MSNPSESLSEQVAGPVEPGENSGTETSVSETAASGSNPRRSRPYLIIACLTALTVFAANGAWQLFGPSAQVIIPPEPEPVELFAEHIELVKSGQSEKIEITKAIITDEEFTLVRDLENLRVLILDAGMLSDAGMEPIGTLSNLVHLRIRNSLITDAGLKHILGLENLRILNLPQANLSPEGMASIGSMKSLRQLRIGGDGTTDLSKSIAELKNLRALHLIDIPVSDEGLREISKLPYLESLYLDNARVTEIGWQWLFDNHPEIHVHINQLHHDRDPNWHRHDFKVGIDDTETREDVSEKAAETLKKWREQQQEEADSDSDLKSTES